MVSVDYKSTAAQCFALAAIMKDPESKAALIAMGRAWLSLAELVGRSESAAPEIAKQSTSQANKVRAPPRAEPGRCD